MQWKLANADSVKCGLLNIADICLGPGDLLTNNMRFSLENADFVYSGHNKSNYTR